MQTFHMVGSVHFDIQGPERVEKMLTQLQPDRVAVEICGNRAKMYRMVREIMEDPEQREKTRETMLSNNPNIHPDTLQWYFDNHPFEYFSARAFSKKEGLPPLFFADPIDFNRFIEIMQNPDSPQQKNSMELLAKDPDALAAYVTGLYASVEEPGTKEKVKSLRDSIDVLGTLEERDTNTIDQLLSLSNPNVVYICGISHIYADKSFYFGGKNLYERMQEKGEQKGFRVVRHKLNEFDDHSDLNDLWHIF